MPRKFTESELEAYLDEALESAEMAEIEKTLRRQPDLLQQLGLVNSRRDAGLHSVGEIWRRHRLSCPTRDQLGSYLLGALNDDLRDYIEFHTQTAGCRFCLANLDDLKRQQAEVAESVATRRRKYFQSSAGYLRSGK
jgi:hypothetical protein